MVSVYLDAGQLLYLRLAGLARDVVSEELGDGGGGGRVRAEPHYDELQLEHELRGRHLHRGA